MLINLMFIRKKGVCYFGIYNYICHYDSYDSNTRLILVNNSCSIWYIPTSNLKLFSHTLMLPKVKIIIETYSKRLL